MEQFLTKEVSKNKFELVIDTKIFKKDIILKAAYTFLNRGYFFFKYNKTGNIILQYTAKEGTKESPESVIVDFADELISVELRAQLELDNKLIRESIVGAAIWNSLDESGFVQGQQEANQIDFDKDIDDILAEIENDPELKIDEDEIADILKEIDEETEKPNITLDINNLENVKKQFNK